MKQVKPLSVKQIESAKPKDKPYRLYDGQGLSLLVKTTNKTWHFNYIKPFTKKRTIISIGTYPTVSLANARAKRDQYRELLSQDIDPQQYLKQQAQQQRIAINHTFYKVSQEWLAMQNYKHNTIDNAKRYLSYAYKFIKDKPVGDIDSFDILTICETIQKEHGSLMASGVKIKIAQVLDFALSRRIITQNIARNINNTHKKHKKGNNPAIIEPKEFAKFLKKIDEADDCGVVIKTYLQIAPYVFVRPSELEQMHISQIDFENKVWKYTPPKTENSSQTQMIVPLSRQVIEKIQFLLKLHGQEYVFYSNRGRERHIKRQRAGEWMRDNGFGGKQTVHGLRASAKTMLEEILEYDPRFVEMQLGHAVKDANGTAYNRAKFIRQRTEMMQAWADYLDSLKK